MPKGKDRPVDEHKDTVRFRWGGLIEESEIPAYLESHPENTEAAQLDDNLAFLWLKRRADEGNVSALYCLGLCYQKGIGISKCLDSAFFWFKKAAERGHAAAQYFIGQAYQKGNPAPRDQEQARRWLKKAADQGYARARYRLASCFPQKNRKIMGESANIQDTLQITHPETATNREAKNVEVPGVGKLLFEASLKGAEQGDPLARHTVGIFYLDGIGVARDEQKAFTWLLMAARGNVADAQYLIGMFYRIGKIVPKDETESFFWLRLAAEKGYAPAQHNLAHCYQYGIGVQRDERKAIAWYMKAAAQGFPEAKIFLALGGHGTESDRREAFMLARKAAEDGQAPFQCILGYYYQNGVGVKMDEQKSFLWFQKAAIQGFKEAQCNLGHCYLGGFGTDRDIQRAMEWYSKAAEQGLSSARKQLELLQKYVGSSDRKEEKRLDRKKSRREEGQAQDAGASMNDDREFVLLRNPATNEAKRIKIGFSWTTFLFADFFGIPLFLRRLYSLGLVCVLFSVFSFMIMFLLSRPVPQQSAEDFFYLGIGLFCIWSLLGLYMGDRANRDYGKKLLAQGWIFAEPASGAAKLARKKWEVS